MDDAWISIDGIGSRPVEKILSPSSMEIGSSSESVILSPESSSAFVTTEGYNGFLLVCVNVHWHRFPGVGLLGTTGGETWNVLKGVGHTGLDRDWGTGAGAR